MARRANLSFGSLNPFGGGATSFGSFSVGGSSSTGTGAKVVDPSEAAYLEFQKVETDWQAGRIDDATYQAAFSNYAGMLTAGTSEAYNAQSRLENMQYTAARDQLTGAIQNGQATWSDLVAFDQASMSGLNPGSQEYRDREARMFAAQTNEFRVAEQQVTDDLQAGRINYTQALGWYQGVVGLYGGNFELSTAIQGTIKQVQTRIVGEQDQSVLDQWKAGTIGLDQLLAYSAQAQAADPNTERARAWADNSAVATTQAIGSSLEYRYGLTEEYRDLSVLVASAKAPTGSSSISHSTQYYVNSAGQWVSQVVSKSTYHAPSASEQQAYQELQVKIAAAKKRMGEIEKMVGTMPGGWVSEDDIIRNLADQQAKTVKGTPAWIELQAKIDTYNDRKAADELLRKSGVVVNLPTSASERAGGLTVGSFERPFATSAGGTKVAPPAKATTSGGGGGGGGGAAAGGGKAGLPATGGGATGGFLMQILAEYVPGRDAKKPSTTLAIRGGEVRVTYKTTGLPAGMTPTDFPGFYTGITKAITKGETTYVNPATGIGYVLPPDPSDRLAMVTALDDKNIELANLKYSVNPTKTNYNGVQSAIKKANTNVLYVMDSPEAGLPAGLPAHMRDQYLAADNKAAPIGAANTWMTRTESQLKTYGEYAQKAFDEGDYERAYQILALAADQIGDDSGPVAKAAYWATVGEQAVGVLTGPGGAAIPGGQVGADVARMRSLGGDVAVTDPTQLAGLAAESWLGKAVDAAGLNDIAKFYDPDTNKNIPFVVNPSTGQPVLGKDGAFQMAPGFVRVVKKGAAGDKIVAERIGTQLNPLTNEMESGDPKQVMVNLQVGNTFVPVLAPFEVKEIGVVVDATGNRTAIKGKVVEVTYNGVTYAVAQDPFNPARWVPRDKGMTFNLPVGAAAVRGSATLGAVGTQITFKMRNDKGQDTGFVLGQEEDGTYTLYSTDWNNNIVPESARNAADPETQRIIAAAGITFDASSLTNNQRNYVNNGLGGIYLGDNDRIIAQSIQLTNTRWTLAGISTAGADIAERNRLATASNQVVRVPTKAEAAATARLAGQAAAYSVAETAQWVAQTPIATIEIPTTAAGGVPSAAAQAAATARLTGLAATYAAPTPTRLTSPTTATAASVAAASLLSTRSLTTTPKPVAARTAPTATTTAAPVKKGSPNPVTTTPKITAPPVTPKPAVKVGGPTEF